VLPGVRGPGAVEVAPEEGFVLEEGVVLVAVGAEVVVAALVEALLALVAWCEELPQAPVSSASRAGASTIRRLTPAA
jgi:hypothetical protein